MAKGTLISLLRRLWRHVSPRRRRQLGLMLVLMILAAGAEILSIGAVLPFLSVLTAPEPIFAHPAAQPVIRLFGLHSAEQLLLPFTIAFGVAALLAGALRLLLLWAGMRLSFAAGADLSSEIYRRTLHQSYAVHIARNSSDIISGMTTKTENVIYYVLIPILTMASSLVILCTIFSTLLWVDPVVALTVLIGFGSLYILIMQLMRQRLLQNGKTVSRESTLVIKALQEGLGGIRDVLIEGSQDTYCQIYRSADLRLRRAQGSSMFISQSPRYGMEALGMLLIAILAYALNQQMAGIGRIVPVLGVLALGAQRLLPLLQQAYNAWSHIQGYQAALQDTLDLLDQPLPDDDGPPTAIEPLAFRYGIRLRQIGFYYNAANEWVFRNVDLTISRGDRIGFIGVTGSGKSTLLDIVMGLLAPTEGALEIDDCVITGKNRRSWQAHIAHVPQSIYLADISIAENIAFGVPAAQIDHVRVRKSAQDAQIADFIESLPEGYDTFAGERGVRLSGGQRQRLGIARALYKRADVIIFDEATSAVDSETEQAIMQAIESLSPDLTILIIAHRLSSLGGCRQIVEVCKREVRGVSVSQIIVSRTN